MSSSVHTKLVEICKIHDLPTNWKLWVPAYYKNDGQLDIPEIWKQSDNGRNLTAYIRPDEDIRIRDDTTNSIFLTEMLA